MGRKSPGDVAFGTFGRGRILDSFQEGGISEVSIDLLRRSVINIDRCVNTSFNVEPLIRAKPVDLVGSMFFMCFFTSVSLKGINVNLFSVCNPGFIQGVLLMSRLDPTVAKNSLLTFLF